MNFESGNRHDRYDFETSSVIEPQHRCKRRQFKCEEQVDMSDMSVTLNSKSRAKTELLPLCEENEVDFLDSTQNCTPLKVDVENTPNLNIDESSNWSETNNDFCDTDENIELPEERIKTEHKYKNVYSFSNQLHSDINSSNIVFDIHLKKDEDETEQQRFFCNLHRRLVDHQETCGIPRTEYPYATLIQEMGQITGSCLLALFYMIISLHPVIQIFLYVVRFILDRLINIRDTADRYQMLLKYVVLGVQLLTVIAYIGFILGFIVIPVLKMGLTIFAKILFFE